MSFHCFLGPLGRWALTLRISCWRRGPHCNAEQMRAGYVPSSHSAATAATYNYKGQERETLQQRGSTTCEPQLILHCTYSIQRCPIISYSIVICPPLTRSHLHSVPGCGAGCLSHPLIALGLRFAWIPGHCPRPERHHGWDPHPRDRQPCQGPRAHTGADGTRRDRCPLQTPPGRVSL